MILQPTEKELIDIGFEYNQELLSYDYWTKTSNILIRYYVDPSGSSADWFITTYSDTTHFFPQSIDHLRDIIMAFELP